MLKPVPLLFVAAALLLAPLAVFGQEESPSVYVYGTYFECDVTSQDTVDEIVDHVYTPTYDAAVADGTLKGWGWLAHHVGGKWRRLLYRAGTSVENVMEAAEKVGDQVEKNAPAASREVGRICNSHDDYIWRQVMSSAGTETIGPRGKVGISAYLVCDMAKEQRADEIFKDTMAPIYSRLVADGKLSSWGWLEHIVGGKYRRLETFTAKDYPTLMQARGEVIDELEKSHKDASAEFDSICNSHQDYLWDIQHEKP